MKKLVPFLIALICLSAAVVYACNSYNANNRDSSSPPVVPNDVARLAIQCATQFNPASEWGMWHCPYNTHCDNKKFPGWSYDSVSHSDGGAAVYDNAGTLVMSATKHNGRTDLLDVNFWGWTGTCYAFQTPCVGFLSPCGSPNYEALACLNN